MAAASPIAPAAETNARRLVDSHGRVIHDLRVSITDRCNYKCVYCRTGEMGAQYPELAIDEYLRLIRLFVTPRHRQGAHYRWRAAPARRPDRADRGALKTAHLVRRAARSRPHHQRTSARKAGRPPEARRPATRHREHGRRGRAYLRAHHPRSRQLQESAGRHSCRPRRRFDSAEDQLRPAARLQRRRRS